MNARYAIVSVTVIVFLQTIIASGQELGLEKSKIYQSLLNADSLEALESIENICREWSDEEQVKWCVFLQDEILSEKGGLTAIPNIRGFDMTRVGGRVHWLVDSLFKGEIEAIKITSDRMKAKGVQVLEFHGEDTRLLWRYILANKEFLAWDRCAKAWYENEFRIKEEVERIKIAKSGQPKSLKLQYMANDPSPKVRLEVAKNVMTPSTQLDILAEDPDPAVRETARLTLHNAGAGMIQF